VPDTRWCSPRSGHHADSPVPSTKLRSAHCKPLAGGRAVDRTHSNRRRLNIAAIRLGSSADPPWKDVPELAVVGFSVAVADSPDLVVAERLVFRTDTREHTLRHNRRDICPTLALASWGHCVDVTSGQLERRPAVVWRRCRRRTGLIVKPRRSLRRPVSTSSPSACFRYFVAFSVERRVYRLSIDDDDIRQRTTRFRAPLPLPLFAAALRCRSSLPRHTTTRASHSCFGKHSLFLVVSYFLFVYSYYW